MKSVRELNGDSGSPMIGKPVFEAIFVQDPTNGNNCKILLRFTRSELGNVTVQVEIIDTVYPALQQDKANSLAEALNCKAICGYIITQKDWVRELEAQGFNVHFIL